MLPDPNSDAARQQALTILIANFVAQGHPAEYAQHMAMTAIFQTDLELRNVQLAHLLSWLKQEHTEIYQEAVSIVASTREEFERRVQE